MSDQENHLIQGLVQRDNRAWENFCRDYSGPLLDFVRLHFSCSQDLAEDIVQMTFIRCVKSIQTFDAQRGSLFGWLVTVARHEAHTLLRKQNQQRQGLQIAPHTRQHLEQLDRSVLPEELLEQKDVRILILRTVMTLKDHYRRVLTMKYLEDQRVAEIAAALGQSEKAVESMLTRARQAFRDVFQKELAGLETEGRAV